MLARTLALGTLLFACPALAQVDYAGQWRAGATRMDVTVESWGQYCGPRPQSTSSSGGGEVEITQSGRQLVIHARGREISSNACWSGNPALKRVSTSVNTGQWTTRCQTAKDDPRAEEGTYTLRADGPDTLLYRDVSSYNWQLKDSKCVATITTTQTLLRAVPTQVGPEGQAAPKAPRCEPGEARHISLSPAQAEIELGGQVCFRARLLDAARCPLREGPRLRLEHSQALKGELSGRCFRAGQSSAEAEGEFQVIAEHGALQARATVVVRAADLSDLLAKRLETGAVTGFEEGDDAVGDAPTEEPPPTTAAKIEARDVRDGGTSRRSIAGMLLAGVALALVLLGVTLWLRSRKRGVAGPAADSYPPPEPTASDATPDAAPPEASATPLPPAEVDREPWICPQCRQGFPASTGRCPKDGTALMPYAEFVAARTPDAGKEHTCPKCGARYPATTKFCGKDGALLGEQT